jgi:hypothetical protein
MNVKSAMRRLKQRSKLPPGNTVRTVPCSTCDTPILYWCDDGRAHAPRCSYCISADRAYHAMLHAP